jgi:hypothetical protein
MYLERSPMHERHLRAQRLTKAVVIGCLASGWLGGCAVSEDVGRIRDTNPNAGVGGEGLGGTTSDSGGTSATTGGSAQAGQFTATGGAPSTGGTSTGGSVSTGGKSATGGVSSTGGSPATGGASATGGKASGGAASTGGAATGGAPSVTGGAPSTTGGAPATGGTSATGGVVSSGGSATGGSPSTAENLLTSSGFETSKNDGWYSRGTAVLTLSAEQAHSGAKSLKVTGRTATWHGAEYDVKSIVTAGKVYDVTVWAKPTTGSAASDLMLTRELQGCGGEQFVRLKIAASATDATWVELSGALSIPVGCTPNKLAIYVESSNATVSYFVDDTTFSEEP